jgi:predicted ATPase
MLPDEDIEKLKPYPELDPQQRRALALAFAATQQGAKGITWRALRFALGAPDLREDSIANRTLFEREQDDLFRPSVIGLLYLTEGRPILDALAAIYALAARRYHPDGRSVSGEDLAAAAGIPLDELNRLEPHLRDLNLGVRGNEGPAGLAILPGEDVWRHRTLTARLAASTQGRGSGTARDTSFLMPRRGALHVRPTRLTVSGFRNLVDLALPLHPLTVLVGRNGVGKSNLLAALRFVGQAPHEGLEAALRKRGGFDSVRTRGSQAPLSLALEMELDYGQAGRETAEYRFALDAVAGRPFVLEESLAAGPADGRRTLFERRKAALTWGASGATEYCDPLALALTAVREDREPFAVEIRDALACQALIDRDPVLSHVASAAPWRDQISLAVVMEHVLSDSRRTGELARVVRELVPSIKELGRRFVDDESVGSWELRVEEEGLPGALSLAELSSGTRQFLALGALYVMDVPPTAILIEEPDGGLHPGAQSTLRDLLRSLSQRSLVLVTTHSPSFVGLLDAEREVVVLERTPVGVRATSLRERVDESDWLRAFSDASDAMRHLAAERGA